MSRPPSKYVDLRPKRLIPKLGILISHPADRQHLGPILNLFDEGEVDLLVHRAQRYPEMHPWLSQQPFELVPTHALMEQRVGYEVLLSQHYIDYLHPMPFPGYPKQSWCYLFRMLGERNVRMLYGLGLDRFNLGDWNQFFEAFLTVSPWQNRQLEDFPGECIEVGYPCYEPYRIDSVEQRELKRSKGFDPDKAMFVYLPTLESSGGTLERYLNEILDLHTQGGQVLVKPHPLAWSREPKTLEPLKEYPEFTILVDQLDNGVLLQMADYVICDYGNSAFSALYMDKPLILLDHPRNTMRERNTDNLLRNYVKHLQPRGNQLIDLVLDSEYWAQQVEIRQELRNIFFSEPGRAAERCVEALRALI